MFNERINEKIIKQFIRNVFNLRIISYKNFYEMSMHNIIRVFIKCLRLICLIHIIRINNGN